jgi:hypothetical protein
MERDFIEMLSALCAAGAEFLVVGAHAVAVHGIPRATGDLDIWVRPTEGNADRVLAALRSFGAPVHDLTREDLSRPDTVFQIGVVPRRIDLLTSLSGDIDFASAWQRRRAFEVGGLTVACIGREDLIANKRACGRPQDLADVARLERGT